MYKGPDRGWGSRPVDGRDWGSSESCEPSVIEELRRRFEQSRFEAGKSLVNWSIPQRQLFWKPFTTDLVRITGHDDAPSELSERETAMAQRSSLNFELEAATGPSQNGELEGLQQFFPDSSPSTESRGDKNDGFDRQVAFTNVSEARSREYRRRQTSFAKHKRMSLFASAINPADRFLQNRKSLFIRPPKSSALPGELVRERLPVTSEFCPSEGVLSLEALDQETVCSVLKNDSILQTIFSHLPEHELLCTASLVSSNWADAATHAHANLMLMSVGCTGASDDDYDSDSESSTTDSTTEKTIPGLLERPWQYLTTNFPWACFLSEGAYKRVYKVFNKNHRVEEAVSVM